AVNGPGEAHDSQLGITFGRNVGMIFKDGVPMRRVGGDDIVEEFVKEVEILRKEGAHAKSLSENQPLVQIS
ncbi:MAG: flavodoxin-dependent (E)-4-hydroxy-3-methylbut-2-enyl-diphosphate synthase, partial [Pyrinomonadaceae bacterium]